MEGLINSDSPVTQLWNYITLRDYEDGGDIFPETSVLTTATRQQVPEDIMPAEISITPLCNDEYLQMRTVSWYVLHQALNFFTRSHTGQIIGEFNCTRFMS
jgi:hypothetical protein